MPGSDQLQPGMFRKIRITILLYILAFVAIGQFLTREAATDWDDPLWVDVYLLNADGSDVTERYIEGLPPDAFAAVETFFGREARRYGVRLDRPFRIEIAGRLDDGPPALPDRPGPLATIWWSLAMRWYTTRLHWQSDRPTPDITLYARFHEGTDGLTLDRSTALRKAMVVVANLFAAPNMAGSNDVVVAHELLHTLGATDKYDPVTDQPVYPIGFADATRSPLFPQTRAELMAGRIPVSQSEAVIPRDLGSVVVGDATALEIGWPSRPLEFAAR